MDGSGSHTIYLVGTALWLSVWSTVVVPILVASYCQSTTIHERCVQVGFGKHRLARTGYCSGYLIEAAQGEKRNGPCNSLGRLDSQFSFAISIGNFHFATFSGGVNVSHF